MSEKFPKKWPKLDPAVWKLFEAQISSMREMAEWYNINKESPVCSDKQVIEDAVVEMAREVYRAAQSLDIESCSAGFHKCRVAKGEIVFDAIRVDPITIQLNANDEKYNLDGPAGWKCPRYFKMAASGAKQLQAQMKKDAKELHKLADKLRPKVSKPFLIDERGWRWPSFWGSVRIGALVGMGGFIGSVMQQVFDQMHADGLWR